jgi:flagella basal body P-ring formation protein FlgA
MKQTSDSLLTYRPIPFNAISDAPILSQGDTGASDRRCTPFTVHREHSQQQCQILLGWSCSPRSFVRYRLGEGRIRSLLHGIRLSLLAVCLTVSFVRAVLGAEGLVISLKEEAAIRSNRVLLKDVANLQGPDSKQLEKLARIPLGPSPEFGSVKTLNRHQVIELIQAEAGPLSNVSLAGAAAVQIRLQGRQIDSGEISSLLKSCLLTTTPWKESEIDIGSIGNLNGVELPPGEVVLRLRPDSTIMGHNSLLAAIEIVQAGETLRCFWITADIDIRARVLAAAKRILPGKVVEPDAVVERLTKITDLRGAYARKPEDVLGKVSRRYFSPGDLLTREAFQNPFLVKNGETVRLRLERNGIVLTSLARAEQNGKLGQVIRVRNLDFSAELKARVTGRAQVMLK